MTMVLGETDPDRAFVAGMLPHHRGAVDMAKVQPSFERDRQMRALAARVIADREREREMVKCRFGSTPTGVRPSVAKEARFILTTSD